MEPIDIFSLAPHEGPYESWPEASELLREGRPTGRTVPGHSVEAQYRVAARHPGDPERFLLAVSQACPHEESNEFILLDADLTELARRSLGRPYESFLIIEHGPIAGAPGDPTAPNAVRFLMANGCQVLILVRNSRPLGVGALLTMAVTEPPERDS